MRVFWKRGYDGASLPELTEAMGINRPSLYAAYGNKESLFRRAVERYVEQGSGLLQESLAQPTARGVVEHLLRGLITQNCSGKTRGCLLVQGALACSEESDTIRQELASQRSLIEKALRQRFERAHADGDLPKSADPEALAKYVATFQNGLAVQSASGATRQTLLAAADVALRAFDR